MKVVDVGVWYVLCMDEIGWMILVDLLFWYMVFFSL